MRKTTLLTAITMLITVAAAAQCPAVDIYTRPDSASNPQRPAMTNNFNWLITKYKLNTLAAAPGNDSIWSPVYQPDNEIVDHLRLALDMKPQDGWELLRREMGYNHDGSAINPKPENPYIVMYNKYSSTLRIFYARGSSAAFTSARITLKFSSGSPTQTSLLDLSQGMIPLDDPFTKDKIFQSPSKFDNRQNQWFFADFPMQYDPCTCYYTSRLAINIDLINEANVDISGSANGKLMAIANNTGAVNQADKTFSFSDLTGAAKKAAKTFKDLNKFKSDQEKAIDTMLKNNTSAATPKKQSLNLFQAALQGSNFLKAGLKALPYIGTAVGLLDFFIGGGKKKEPAGPQEVKLTPTSIDMTIKLSGTITASYPYGSVIFWNPGSNIAAYGNEDYPYYNEIMGIFNLTEAPKAIKEFKREQKGETRDEIYYVTTHKYRIQSPIKYALNPASRLAIQDAQVAIVVEGDSSKNGPAGGVWELEGKNQENGNWQYRSAYTDVECLNKTVFNITGSSAPNNINWLPAGKTYLKILLNLKRLTDTTDAQNVLLVAKYQLKLDNVTSVGSAGGACTGGLFLPATSTEINTLCTSTKYKTNRAARIRITSGNEPANELEKTITRAVLGANPTSSYSTLLLETSRKIRLNIYVTDVTGRKVQVISSNREYSRGTANEQIDAAQLPSGIYNLVIEKGNNRMVKKWIIQK